MSTKKKLAIIIPIAAVLLAGIIAASVIIWMAFFRKVSLPPLEDKGYATVCYEPPADGSTPADYTGVENIGYMNWRLQHTPYWYSEMHSDISNSAAPQKVETYKQFHDGVLISADISTSSLINTAIQFCVAGDAVMWRPAAVNEKGYNGINTPWSEGTPSGLTIPEYKTQRGLPPTEFSVYVINENTVLKAYDVVQNADGTYTQKFDLNPAHDPDENSAVYYYKKQMQVTGNLASMPTFEYITVTYTFDASWRVLKMEAAEKYVADKGIKASCSSTSLTEYVYDDEQLTINPAYEEYFKNYAEDFAPPEVTLTAADCLSSAFAPVVNGTATLKAGVGITEGEEGKTSQISGLVTLNLGQSDVRADLGNIKAYLKKEGEDKFLYLALGKNFNAKIDLADFSSPARASNENVLDGLLSDLGSGQFTVAEDSRSARLTATLNLNDILNGLLGGGKVIDFGKLLGIDIGPKIELVFDFTLSEDMQAGLDKVTAQITGLGATSVTANLNFAQTPVPELGAKAAEFVPLSLKNAADIIKDKAMGISLEYAAGGATLTGDVNAAFSPVFNVNANLTLGGKGGAAKNITADYIGQKLYLKIASGNLAPAVLKADGGDISGIISLFMPVDKNTGALQTLLGIVKKVGMGNIIGGIFAENGLADLFTLNKDGTLILDGDAIVNALMPSSGFAPGGIEVTFGDSVRVSCGGLTADIHKAEKSVTDLTAYAGAVDFGGVIQRVAAIAKDKKFTLTGDIDIQSQAFTAGISGVKLSADFSQGLTLGLDGSLNIGTFGKDVTLRYQNGVARVGFGGVGVQMQKEGLTPFMGQILGLYNSVAALSEGKLQPADTQKTEELINSLSGAFEGLGNILSSLSTLDIYGAENGGIAIKWGDAEIVIRTSALSAAEIRATYSSNGVNITLGGAKLNTYTQLSPDAVKDCFDLQDAMPIISSLNGALAEGGLTLSGGVNLNIKNLPVVADIQNLSIGFKDGLKINAHAVLEITQNNGDGTPVTARKDIYAEYGAAGLKIVYDGTGIDVKAGDLQGFKAALGSLYSAIAKEVNGGVPGSVIPDEFPLDNLTSLFGGGEGDISAKIGDVLKKAELIKTESGNLAVLYGGLRAEITGAQKPQDGDIITLNISYLSNGASVSAEGIALRSYNAHGALPQDEIAYFDGGALIPVMEGATEAITSAGITLSGELHLTSAAEEGGQKSLKISLTKLTAGWADGLKLYAEAAVDIEGVLNKNVTLYYGKDISDNYNLTLVYDGLGIVAEGEAFNGLNAAITALYNGIAQSVNAQKGEKTLPELGGIDTQSLKNLFSSRKINIAQILNDINLIKEEDGGLTVNFGKISCKLSAGDGNIMDLSLSADLGGTNLKLRNCSVKEGYSGGNLPDLSTVNCLDAADITPIINHAAQAVKNKGITLGGGIDLQLDNTSVSLDICSLSVGFENGAQIALDARLTVNGSAHDFYADYSSGKLKIIYGSSLAAILNVPAGGEEVNDIDALKDALVALYNRIAAVVNKIASRTTAEGQKEVLGKAGSLDDVLTVIGLGGGAADDIKSLLAAFTGANTQNILKFIQNLAISKPADAEDGKGVIRLDYNGLALELFKTKGGLCANFITSSVTAHINSLKIISDSYTPIEAELPANALTADDFAELLDYLGGAVELAAKDALTIGFTGNVTTTEEVYEKVDGVKYNIDGKFEYVQGEEYPLHLEIKGEGEDKDYNLWVSPDMYAHMSVNMRATLPEADSVLFDIYILDADPEVEGGKTAEGQVTQDGVLDVYMSVGRILNGYTDADGNQVTANPVKIYAPVSEIAAIASAAVAMADVGSIKVGGGDVDPALADTINGIIAKVGGLLDKMLVNKYLPGSSDRFASLGASLIERILGGSVSDKLNGLLSSLGGRTAKAQAEESAPVTPQRERLGLDLGIDFKKDNNGGTLTFKYGQTTATVTKDASHRLTGLNIDKTDIKHGQNVTEAEDGTVSTENYTETLNGFTINLGYAAIEKTATTAGYYDLRGADTLVESLVVSATHPTEEAVSGKAYDINREYFISGSLNLKISGVLDHTVTIDGLLVKLDGDNNISLDAKISYEGAKGLGIITAILGDSQVYISVKNGMIYLKRIQTTKFDILGRKQDITPITIYRAMPVDMFMADIMNQLFFVLNINEGLVNNIMDMVGSGGGGEPQPAPRQDYGTQMADYLQSFTVSKTDETAVWEIILNGAGINRLAGMDGLIGDGLKVTFNAQKPQDGSVYLVNSLGISGTLLKAFTVSGNLGWQNSGNVYKEGAEDVKNAIVASSPGADISEMLGGIPVSDIYGFVDWERLGGYLEFEFEGDAQVSSNIKYESVPVEFYVQDGPSKVAVQGMSPQPVLRNADTNEIYSQFTYPDISAYNREGCTLIWQTPEYSEGTYAVTAIYMPQNLKVTMYSAVELGGAEAVTGVEGYTGQVYKLQRVMSSSYLLESAQATGYEFLGWYYKTPSGGWQSVTDLSKLQGITELTEVEVHALWFGGITLKNFACDYTRSGGIIKTNYYNAQYEVCANLLGPLSINPDVTFSLGLYANDSADMGNAQKTLEVVATQQGLTFTASGNAEKFSSNVGKNNVFGTAHLNVGVTISLGGEIIFSMAATEQTHFTCGVVSR